MSEKRSDEEPRIAIPLDPEEALRAMLAVNPDDEAADDDTQHE